MNNAKQKNAKKLRRLKRKEKKSRFNASTAKLGIDKGSGVTISSSLINIFETLPPPDETFSFLPKLMQSTLRDGTLIFKGIEESKGSVTLMTVMYIDWFISAKKLYDLKGLSQKALMLEHDPVFNQKYKTCCKVY